MGYHEIKLSLVVNRRDVVIVTHDFAVAMKVEDQGPVPVTGIETAGDINARLHGDKEVKCILGWTREIRARIKDVVQKMRIINPSVIRHNASLPILLKYGRVSKVPQCGTTIDFHGQAARVARGNISSEHGE
jgi:hypothetical protein